MPELRKLKSGSLLAISNIYAAIASFAILSMIFNRVGLHAFGKISFLLTTISIFQILFNTQSWQGLLRERTRAAPALLRACLAIDATVAAGGALLLYGGMAPLTRIFGGGGEPDTALLWLTLNVALIPPGALLAVIRGDDRFSLQAVVDIVASTVKFALGILVARSVSPLDYVALALVAPEVVRWLGYLAISLSPLRDAKGGADRSTELASTASNVKQVYRFCGWGMLSEISHLPSAHLDKIIVSSTLGLEFLAIWDIVKRCVLAIVQVTNVLNQMLFPHFVRRREEVSRQHLLQDTLRKCGILALAIGLTYLIMILSFNMWFPRLFHLGARSPMSAEAIRNVMAALALVMTFVLGAIPVHPLFLSLRHSAETFRLSLTGNVLSLVLTWLLTGPMGLYGAVIAILASDAFIIFSKVAIIHSSIPSTRLAAR
jgi:O-antigen/teichoic acid export membrane protein